MPYVAEYRAAKKSDAVALVLLDAWAAHTDVAVVRYLAQNKIKVIPIEPSLAGGAAAATPR